MGMTKRDGTEILPGTASIGGDGTETALAKRLGELKPLAEPVILADLTVGMKTARQAVKMDFDQNMGNLYPFSLAEKLKVITEPSARTTVFAADEEPVATMLLNLATIKDSYTNYERAHKALYG